MAPGFVAGAAPRPDPFGRLEHQAQRRAWLAPAGFAAIFAAFVIIMTILQPPTADQLASYALNIGTLFVLLLAFGFLMQYLVGRGIRRFTPLKPRVKEAKLARRGPSLMLDDGLLVCFFLSNAFLTRFFAVNGSPIHPRLDEALLWTRPRRLKFARMVRSRTGPREARADLDALVARVGVGYAIATVHEGRTPAGETMGPRWVVSVNLFRLYRGPDVQTLASRLDEVIAFMNGFLQPTLAGAAPQAFPRRNMALGIAAMAVLPVLLVAAFLWPDFALVLLTVGMVFIFAVAFYGMYAMRVRPPAKR